MAYPGWDGSLRLAAKCCLNVKNPGGRSAAPGYERPDVDGTRLSATLADFLRM
jgi:hypothetical protein